jgi:hypothetical protein
LRFARFGILVANVVLIGDAVVQGVVLLGAVGVFGELLALFALSGAFRVALPISALLPRFAELFAIVAAARSEQKKQEEATKIGAPFRRHESLILHLGAAACEKSEASRPVAVSC